MTATDSREAGNVLRKAALAALREERYELAKKLDREARASFAEAAAQRPAILDLPHVHPADDPTLTANQRAAGRVLAEQTTGRRLRTLDEIEADNRGAASAGEPVDPAPRWHSDSHLPVVWGLEYDEEPNHLSSVQDDPADGAGR